MALVTLLAPCLLLAATPAHAVPGGPPPLPVGSGPDTVLTMTGTAEGVSVSGFLPPSPAVTDPSVAYPAAPPAGHVIPSAGFAGIITAQEFGGAATLRLYCIDVRTNTYPGIGYENGSWEDTGQPNVGYVALILSGYFPEENEPASAPDDNVRASAVQAAIWYFTDNFVLDALDPVRPFTEAIVNAVRVMVPPPYPDPLSLSVTPVSISVPIDTIAGSFTVNATTTAEVSAAGGTMYADAATTVPIPNGTVVPNGQQIWVVPAVPGVDTTVTITAQGTSSMPSGNVFLYDGTTAGVPDAQRLVLAESVVTTANVVASAVFFTAGTPDPELAASGMSIAPWAIATAALIALGALLVRPRRS